MHNRHALAAMRVGIGGNGRAMCRPACVADTDRATKRRCGQSLAQGIEFSLGAEQTKPRSKKVMSVFLITMDRLGCKLEESFMGKR